MPSPTGSVTRLMLAAGVLVATRARAQDSWFVDDVPDFDQRRLAGSGAVGLPAGGDMYCVPTATLNWFAYLANHGTPQTLTLDGPRDWQSQDNYNRVGDTLNFMGAIMQTDPQDGTGGGGQAAGAAAYNFLYCSSDFVFLNCWALGKNGQKHAPSPDLFLTYHTLGGHIQTSYGFYSGSPRTRDGGHALTAIGVWDLTGGANPIFQFRDPWTKGDDSSFDQSRFRVSLAAMTGVHAAFRASSDSTSKNLTLYRLDTSDVTGNFLDSMMVVAPALGIFSVLTEAGEVEVVRPFRPDGNPLPEVQHFNKPAFTGGILDIAPAWDLLSYYYITDQGVREKPQLWKLDALSGATTPALDSPFAPTRLALGREDDAYLIEGSNVVRYDLSTTPGTRLADFEPSQPARAIAYNDLNDRVIILTAPPAVGSRRVLIFPSTLTGFGTNRPLPVALTGEVHVCPDAEDSEAFWVSGQSGVLGLDAVAYRIAPEGSALVVTDTITYPRNRITGLCVSAENGVILTIDDELVELIKNTHGDWVGKPASRWTGRQAGGAFTLARSRSNFDAATMVGPTFNNILDPMEYPSHPDCYADCDGDGALTIFDFLCFQNKFEGRDLAADCDLDGRFTIFDFLCFQNAFDAGCGN